jgi:hypothetical protein
MDYGLSLCRDTLTLNDKLAAQLAQRLAAGKVPLGSPVLIAARELRVVGDFQLFGHDLVVLADQLDGGQGQVIVSAPVGEAGRHVTVGCRKLLGLNVQAPGGEGAGGEPGAPGRPGKPGFQGRGRPAAGPDPQQPEHPRAAPRHRHHPRLPPLRGRGDRLRAHGVEPVADGQLNPRPRHRLRPAQGGPAARDHPSRGTDRRAQPGAADR